MSFRTQTNVRRWAALLQGILLAPTILAGSVCLHDGKAATLELGVCPCLQPAGPEAAPTISTPTSPECGACRDVTLAAHAGSRAAGFVPQPILEPSQSLQRPHAAQPGPISGGVMRTGDPPERLAVLRC